MKIIIKSFFALACLLPVIHSQAQGAWEAIGPANITIYSFGVNDPYLFSGAAGNDGGIFLTTDNGDHWTEANTGIPGDGSPVESIAISDTSMMAGVSYRGVYVSTDTGHNWEHVVITSIPALGANTILFADAPWNKIIMAGGKLKGTPAVITSVDGIHWIELTDGLPVAGSIHAIMTRDTNIFAGTVNGVYRSSINADHWQPSNAGMGTPYIYSLSQNENYMIAGTDRNGLFRSTDGTNWFPKNTGLQISETRFNSILFYGDDILVAASGDHGGVFRSSDSGEHWYAINTGLPINPEVNALAIQGPYLFAGTKDNGVYRIALSEITGSKEIAINAFKNNLSIYPNPSGGFVTVSISPTPGITQHSGSIFISCSAVEGQDIFTKEYTLVNGEIKTTIDISKIPNGMYVLQIRNEQAAIFSKLIIQK